MGKIIKLVLLQTVWITAIAQQKSFEGTAVYTIDVKSKQEGITDRAWRKMLALGDTMRVSIKNGNYRQRSEITDIYFIAKRERAYLKFTGIDTLYFLDYSSDTTTVTSISRTGEVKTIAGFTCKPISISTAQATRKYYYSPDIYMDPGPDLNNRIGRYDVFAKETSSLYLGTTEETNSFLLGEQCIRLQRETIDDSIFELPQLPEKKFTIDAIIKPAEYKGSSGWIRYLETHINAELAAKYVKLGKKESMASQVVMVGFTIDENGRVTNVQVLNKGEGHSKLEEEAIRVVSASPSWKPATVFGEKIKYWHKQPITFAVTR